MAASRLPLVVVLGATGAGKSKLAIEIAKLFNGEVISADSMQIYKGLDIISNKVTEEEQRECPHHMISYLEASSRHNTVVDFRDKALPIIDNILQRDRMPVIVGGTNYYIESVMWDLLVNTNDLREGKVGADKSTDTDIRSSEPADIVQDISLPRSPPTCTIEDKDHTKKRKVLSVGENGKRSRRDEVLSSSPSNVEPSPPSSPSNHSLVIEDATSDSGKDPGIQTQESNTLLWLNKLSTDDLYARLTKVDPETAQRNHPNNRRKILRALQVFHESGIPLSCFYANQHSGHQGPTGPDVVVKSGPLRYKDPCILWVTCQQKTLNDRLDSRVDSMLERGLLQELEEFHTKARDLSSTDDTTGHTSPSTDSAQEFPHGILQMIGFKEFKQFLRLPQPDRQTEHGHVLFRKGVEDLKTVTRRYARQQVRWIRNRFCSRPGPEVPKVYSVDTTDLDQWPQALQGALDVVDAFTKGDTPKQTPEPTVDRSQFQYQRNVCDVCGGRVFLHIHEWEGHIRSKKHRHNVKKLSKQRQDLSSILSAHESQLASDVGTSPEIGFATGDLCKDNDIHSSNSNSNVQLNCKAE